MLMLGIASNPYNYYNKTQYTKNNAMNRGVEATNTVLSNAVDQYEEKIINNSEKTFNSYGPNAPESVKQAWMEAEKETGSNGAGMLASGKATHISAMSAERAVRHLNGDPDYADILGNSVESAISAAEKALYDLENPLLPLSTRKIEVQNEIAKEKEFYISFLEKLKGLQ